MNSIVEKPYAGRATTDEWIDRTIITIPTARVYFQIIFLGLWLALWLFAEITMALTLAKASDISGFEMFVEVFWAVVGFFAIRDFIWVVAGKEIVTVTRDYITIENKYLLLNKPRTYLLQEVKNIRVIEEAPRYISFSFWRNRTRSSPTSGTIWFDYGMKTIGFASGVNDIEALHIIDKLKSKKLLVEKHF